MNHALGFKLGIGISKAHLHASGVKGDVRIGDMALLQRVFNLRQQRLVYLGQAAQWRHLHRGRFAVKVGQRVDQAEQYRRSDKDIFPQGIAVHAGLREE